jgi:hypothetical protein
MLRKRLHVAGVVTVVVSLSTLMLGQAATAELGEEGATGWRRAEVPDAGLSLGIPAAWDDSLVVDAEPEEVVLPEEYDDMSPAYSRVVYVARTFDASSYIRCELAEYQDIPLSLQEHADWLEQLITTAPDFNGFTQSQSFDLPIGESIRVDFGQIFGEQHVRYLFDLAGVRYHLECESDWSLMPEEGWLEMAQSIEPLAETASEQGGTEALVQSIDTKSVAGYWDHTFVVPPDHPTFPAASLMWSWCDIATWLVADDGSATEWFACILSDEPYEPADQQGVPPDEVLTLTGGPCGWWSSYWWQLEQRRVHASAYRVTVTPDGLVFGRAEYPAEPLVCES